MVGEVKIVFGHLLAVFFCEKLTDDHYDFYVSPLVFVNPIIPKHKTKMSLLKLCSYSKFYYWKNLPQNTPHWTFNQANLPPDACHLFSPNVTTLCDHYYFTSICCLCPCLFRPSLSRRVVIMSFQSSTWLVCPAIQEFFIFLFTVREGQDFKNWSHCSR